MAWEDFRADTRDFARDMRPHLMRWLRRPWSGHAYVNLIVEACGWPGNGVDPGSETLYKLKDGGSLPETIPMRHAPGYYSGHWLALVVIPISGLSLITCAVL